MSLFEAMCLLGVGDEDLYRYWRSLPLPRPPVSPSLLEHIIRQHEADSRWNQLDHSSGYRVMMFDGQRLMVDRNLEAFSD